MKKITYDIHSFKWDVDSNTFYGDAWNLQEVGNIISLHSQMEESNFISRIGKRKGLVDLDL
jgi:hypothetical protein